MRFLNTLMFVLFCMTIGNAQTVWTGAVDSDWNNPANWNAGVPSSGVLATISGGAINQPTYAGSTVLDFTIQNAGTLTFNTIVYNVGSIINFGGATIVNDNQIINAGAITFDNDGILNNNGTFDNYGIYDHAASAILNNATGAAFNSYGSFNSNGQINNDGLLNIAGSFSNSNGMANTGTFQISGMASFPFGSNLDNTGNTNILSGGTLDINGSLPNNGSITNDGMLAVQSAAVLTNESSITNNNELDLGGQLLNNSTLANNSNLNISSSGILENNATVTNSGLITLEICGKLIQNATNNIGGNIENEGLVYEINGTVDEVNGDFGETFTDLSQTPAPIPACKGDVVLVLDVNGVVNFTGEDIDQGRSYGSCGASLVSFDVSPNQFTTADIGVRIVTLTITDNFGVSSSCEDFVLVTPMPEPIVPIDDADITFDCPNNITVDTEPGGLFTEVTWTEPTAETTCDPAGGGGSGTPDCNLVSNNISGFTYLGEHNNSKYFCSASNHTWAAALALVQASGGHLAVINNASENQYLQTNVIASTAWIGYTDEVTEGTFVWVNGEPTTYTNWDAGEPNNYNNSDGVVLLKNTGLWRDRELTDSYEVIMEVPCPLSGNCNNVDLTFVFDNYPEDISWDITDANGTIVNSGGNYGNEPDGSTLVETTCLPDGCYDLNIYDSYGDGLCCAYGNGSYSLTDPNGVILASGASFGSQETTNFCLALQGGGDPELTVTQISGPPNGGNFVAGVTEVAYEVTDVCGNQEVCIFEVTVNPIPATFVMTGCPGDIVLDAAPGATSAVATWTDPSGSSDCFRGGPIGVEQTFGLDKGTDFPIGTSNVGYAVFDSCGNFASCLFNVTINFVTANLTVADCSEDINIVSDAGSGGAIVTWDAPTGSSDCYLGSTASVEQIGGPASGSFIPNGSTEIIYLLTDDCVNTELCIFNVVVTEATDPCAGNGGDADGDGVCADVDCDDNDSSLPATPGTSCDDGDSNTENDVILGDGCSCAGTVIVPCSDNGGDADGDGVCADVDCDDNDSSLPAAPGTSCDDGDSNTENDVILGDGCSCAGTVIVPCSDNGGDADGDGVCADVDCDDNDSSLPAAPGTSCDDGDSNTENDVILGDGCSCAGTVIVPCSDNGGDADGDGVCADVDCDDNDSSLPAAPGTSCDDGDSNTENDVILSDGCGCEGTPIVTGCNPMYSVSGNDITFTGLEGPHVAVNIYNSSWNGVFSCLDDCDNPLVVNLPDDTYYVHVKIFTENWQIDCQIQEYITIDGGGACTPGATCNDNDDCTDNDIYDVDCNCVGTYSGDVDGDGVCANEDCDDNDSSLPAPVGSACDDGNADTENDVILSDGCTCEGTIIVSCANNGGDADGDGVCADVDCDDNDSSLPAAPGTSCDDGDANTENDVILSDGCTCEGTPPNNGCNPAYSVNGNDVTITGLEGPHVAVDIYNSSWNNVFECFDDCDNPSVVTLPEDTYYIHIKIFTAGWQVDCQIQEYFTISGGSGCTPGATCNDNDPCTDNDVYDIDCNCAGTYSGDADGDGVCANEDCDDNNSSLPASPGTTCDDGNVDTSNDEIQDDGCTCEGTIEGECDIQVSTGPGSITIDGLTGANVIVQIFDSSWSSVFSCLNDCDNPQVVTELANGTYYVKATNYDDGWKKECEVAEYYTVTGGTGFQSNTSEFLFFNAAKNGREVSLNWTTNTEFKNVHFEVERSLDGINFTTIQGISSKSESTAPMHYQDEDGTPIMGTNFYRLKQIFADGTYRYSSIDVVVFEIDVDAFTLFPNPTADQVFVSLKQFEGESASIQIYNSLGTLMHTIDAVELSDAPIGFDVSKYPGGIYHMTIKVGDRKRMANLFVVSRL